MPGAPRLASETWDATALNLEPRGIPRSGRDDKVVVGLRVWSDSFAKAVLRLKENLELNAFGQVELWKAPVLASGQQHDFTGSIQITYFPKLSWQR